MATVADAANVREGLVNILSGFITQLNRPSYPAFLQACVVVVIEVDEKDAARAEDVDFNVTLSHESMPEEPVASIDARFKVEGGSEGRAGYLPIVLNTVGIELPSVGKYVVAVRCGEYDQARLTFYASQVDSVPAG